MTSNSAGNPRSGQPVRTSRTDPLRVDALSAGPAGGQIGITICPGKQGPSLSGFEWRRDLDADLQVVKAWGAAAVVSLIEDHEFESVKVTQLGLAVQALGMEWHHLPIKDMHAPDERFERAWRTSGPVLLEHLRAGRRLLIHCMGGRGRAGTVAARLLIELGEAPEAAIARVREAREGAIETRSQRQYLLDLPRRDAQASPPLPSRQQARPTPAWFEELAGFKEQTGPVGYRQTQSRFAVEGARLRSLANGKSYGIGRLELLSLRELRQRAGSGLPVRGECRIRAIHGEAGQLHADAAHHRALFQVASQFNLLEMAGPGVVPEEGVTGYVNDPTQGPACAIAAGAATIYRNYFVPVNGEIGQRADRQIDGLASLGAELGRRMNEPAREIWTMRNGYAMFEPRAVGRVSNYLAGLDEGERDAIRQMLQIGVQWDVEVTAGGAPQGQQVTQAFCSALPIGYHHDGQSALEQWEPVARLVLDALYEATLWAAVINAQNGGSRTVLLTFVGGGVFRNKVEWIRSAIERAVRATAGHGLDIVVVYFHAPTALDRSWVGTLGSAA